MKEILQFIYSDYQRYTGNMGGGKKHPSIFTFRS